MMTYSRTSFTSPLRSVIHPIAMLTHTEISVLEPLWMSPQMKVFKDSTFRAQVMGGPSAVFTTGVAIDACPICLIVPGVHRARDEESLLIVVDSVDVNTDPRVIWRTELLDSLCELVVIETVES